MKDVYFKVKKLDKRAIIPSKRDEDAGYDLYAIIDEDYKILEPGKIFLFPTKLSVEIPKDYVLYLAERGSTGTKGISKRAGVIDSGFRGEIQVVINNTSNKIILFYKDEEKVEKILKERNLSKENITLYPLSKGIAQAMLLYCPHVEVEEVYELNESLRQDGMLGSSKK
jgi:dUTP pyrophosphatase